MKTEQPKPDAVETRVTRLIRNIAKDKARSLRWNTTAVAIIYAILITIALLELNQVDNLLITSFAVLGLLTFWGVNWAQWKKLEKRLYQEESRNLQEVISAQANNADTIAAETAPLSLPPLTERELEILEMVAAGDSNKEIAGTLSISIRTVDNHVSHILSKLGTASRTSAAILALSNGWIKGEPGKVSAPQ